MPPDRPTCFWGPNLKGIGTNSLRCIRTQKTTPLFNCTILDTTQVGPFWGIPGIHRFWANLAHTN